MGPYQRDYVARAAGWVPAPMTGPCRSYRRASSTTRRSRCPTHRAIPHRSEWPSTATRVLLPPWPTDTRVGFEEFSADVDAAPLFRGLPDDRCQCPHWGYVISGRLILRYAHREEQYEAGDAYYAPPGHTPVVFAGTRVVEFSRPTHLPRRRRCSPRTCIRRRWRHECHRESANTRGDLVLPGIRLTCARVMTPSCAARRRPTAGAPVSGGA